MSATDPIPHQLPEQTQKIIRKTTRLAGAGFVVAGLLVLVLTVDLILGPILMLIGVGDLLFARHVEKFIEAKLNQRHDKG